MCELTKIDSPVKLICHHDKCEMANRVAEHNRPGHQNRYNARHTNQRIGSVHQQCASLEFARRIAQHIVHLAIVHDEDHQEQDQRRRNRANVKFSEIWIWCCRDNAIDLNGRVGKI